MAERLSEAAIFLGSSRVKTRRSRVSASLSCVTRCDQRRARFDARFRRCALLPVARCVAVFAAIGFSPPSHPAARGTVAITAQLGDAFPREAGNGAKGLRPCTRALSRANEPAIRLDTDRHS